MGPRTGLSSVLIVGALVLLIAIVVGENMGNRVLGQIASRGPAIAATPIPAPSVSPNDPGNAGGSGTASWKRHEVISVATDPGFPDPRVTPEPPPPPTARPTPRPTPRPSATPTSDSQDDGSGDQAPPPPYTSPPLPMPLISHGPEDAPSAEVASPAPAVSGRGVSAAGAPHPAFSGRGYPTLPPYSAGTPLP